MIDAHPEVCSVDDDTSKEGLKERQIIDIHYGLDKKQKKKKKTDILSFLYKKILLE